VILRFGNFTLMKSLIISILVTLGVVISTAAQDYFIKNPKIETEQDPSIGEIAWGVERVGEQYVVGGLRDGYDENGLVDGGLVYVSL